MHDIRRKLYSQNFFHNRKLISQLVDYSSIGKQDLVIEIGPGKGIITEKLLSVSNRVIAVEVDTRWCFHCQRRFQSSSNFQLIHQDFLKWKLPSVPYKVFANLPFSIEGKIIRKLLGDPNPPREASLVVMKELAERLVYKDRQMFSALYRPWFEFTIVHHFSPADFIPKPKVNAVLFQIRTKNEPKIPWQQREKYQQFIRLAYTDGKEVFKNLEIQYPRKKIQKAFRSLSLNKKVNPNQVFLANWIVLFEFITT